jgi:signal transduction histidine kinase
MWGMIAGFIYFQDGLKSPTVVAYYWVIVAAGLLLGDWGGPAYAGLTIAFSFFLYNQQIHHQLPPAVTGLMPEGFLLSQVSTGFATGFILYITSRSIRNALNQARQSNRALTEALAKKEQAEAALHQLNLSLEEQVRQRTADLELANRELKLLHEQAEKTAVMEERHRLARELHDSTCQMLSGQVLMAEAGLRMIRQGDLQRSVEHLTRVRDVAHEVHRDMRLLLYELRPPLLGENSLMDVLRQRLEGVERRTGIEASLIMEGDKLPAPVEEAFYRVAWEALNNASKHAAATSVKVLIHAEGEQAELEVTDNGRGFDPEAASQRGGLGLMTMRERVEKLGGIFVINSSPGNGTQVKANLAL